MDTTQNNMTAHEQALWMIATGRADASDSEMVEMMRDIAIEALGDKWLDFQRAKAKAA